MTKEEFIDKMLAAGLIDNTTQWNGTVRNNGYKWFSLPGLYNNVAAITFATSKKAVLYDTFYILRDGRLHATGGRELSFEEIVERIPNVIRRFNKVKKLQRLNKIKEL